MMLSRIQLTKQVVQQEQQAASHQQQASYRPNQLQAPVHGGEQGADE
jgi:hypothetical protein